MRTFKYTLIGFLLFAATVAFNVTLGIVVYSFVKEEGKLVVGLVILATIFCSSLICTIIDYFRRKYTVARPLEDILDVTRLMAQGNFKVRLSPYHSYNRYDEFDRIIDNLNKMAEELSKSEMLKNDFIANIPLSVTFRGKIVNPEMSLTDSDGNIYATIKFRGITLQAGQKLVVDGINQRITLYSSEDAVSGTDYFNEIDKTTDTFLMAIPGVSNIIANLDGTEPTNPSVEVSYVQYVI